MKFKVGDRVQIIKRKYGHGLVLGSVVVIKEVDKDNKDYRCGPVNSSTWVRNDEIAPVKKEIEKKVQ